MGDYQRMQRVTRTTALSQLGNLRWMWGRSFHSSSYSWKSPEPFSVLGIETSCDDTCAAVVGCDGRVWAHALSSQFQLHAPYHGIVPSLAARAHEAHIDTIVDQVLQEASQQHGTLLPPVHCVAVTAGPGLKPCLGVGLKKAQQIAEDWNVPLLPIHHLEAHALVPRLPSLSSSVEFPFLLLLVSGGHTQLIECQGVGHYRILGTTLDDAVGEAFDKTARLLGLQPSPDCHPGEQLERLAQEGDPSAIQFTLPLSKRKKSCDFSYSGLKTQVRRKMEQQELHTPSLIRNVAAAFQQTATAHLVDRVRYALHTHPSLSTLVVAGGVARNRFIRSQLDTLQDEKESLQIVYPPLELCTDNGVMTAWAGVERILAAQQQGQEVAWYPKESSSEESHSLEPFPRWPISEAYPPSGL